MSVTAALVKELRERTNAGMMECKKALVEANGDIEKAIEAMRKSGQAKAVKKAGRTTSEGTIVVLRSSDAKRAVLIEVNCETDFVAREAKFQQFAHKAAELALQHNMNELEEVQTAVEEIRLELVSQLGENITVRRFVTEEVKEGVMGTYGHGDANGVRIGVMVALSKGEEVLARDLAMHIAAMNPEYLTAADVPSVRLEKEKEIFMDIGQQEGKSGEMLEKIVAGKLKKFTTEISLLGQAFVKDPSKTIETLLKEANAQVKTFVRFEVGEGIEKKTDNFVEDVMAQVRGE
jgi:elongation factor Ts